MQAGQGAVLGSGPGSDGFESGPAKLRTTTGNSAVRVKHGKASP
jgi:hypothetical protein